MGRPDKQLRARIRERFVVTLTSGDAFDGLLWEVDAKVIVLRDAAAVSDNGARLPVDGEVIAERARIAFMQRPTV